MKEDMKVYLFAQALNNDSADDWYEYTNNTLKEITEENDQSLVNSLIFELTGTGKKQQSGKVEGYYKLRLTGSVDLVLLIDNDQKDNIGRQSKTALIIKNYQNDSLNFEEVLTLFWKKTNRNTSDLEKARMECDQVVSSIKRKNTSLCVLVPLALAGVGLSTVFSLLLKRSGRKQKGDNQ